jgi:hypothetical protein
MNNVSDKTGGVSKTLLKTEARYLMRLRNGERIMRDAQGGMQWSDGKSLGAKTVEYMLSVGSLHELDTDLFGDKSHGQTLGLN